MIELYPFQDELVGDLRSAIRAGSKSPLLVSPTGSGKTVIFAYLVSRMAEKGVRSHILAPRKEIIRQISNTLTQFGTEHGFCAAGRPYDPDQLIHVGSVYTVARRLDQIPVPDYAIIDEAHHAIPESTWDTCVKYWREKNTRLILPGVTATPERLSGEGLRGTFDSMIVGPSVRELIDAGFLSDYKIFAPANAVDVSKMRTLGGEYRKDDMEGVMVKSTITGNAVDHYKKYLSGKPAIAFCISIRHAQHVAHEFQLEGFNALSVDGKMSPKLRESITQSFADGKLDILCSCDLISEGYDVPGVWGAILLRPTMSKALFLQQVGRCLRKSPGKDVAFILDHVGNWARHGLPDTVHEWSLDSKRRKASDKDPDDIAIKQCPECGFIVGTAALECSECGYVFETKGREIQEVEGELVEITEAQRAMLALPFRSAVAECDDLMQLYEYGKLRKMKNPWYWAQHVMAARRKRA